ncbi:sialidase family protein [Maribacter dokdonensis]|uniref:sialidase family protein n=1 Tax=Maribacter dokdonensis TaxID=320912 RepID=UPI000B83E307|nr:sialidase family protein [Maribacter dokdonensis]
MPALWSHVNPGAHPDLEKGKSVDSTKLVYKIDNYPEIWIAKSLKKPKFYSKITTVPDSVRTHDEHMLIQLKDSSYYCLIRTKNGIEELRSNDGMDWSRPDSFSLVSPRSKFFISRLKSGRILLVINNSKKRERLTAFLSEDECVTWSKSLLIDERMGVSYPDAVEGKNGNIILIYDRNRKSDQEIIIARFNESDILNSNYKGITKEIITNFNN